MGADADSLDRTVAFLAKRDGTDKVLKLIRYTAKLILATSLDGADTPAARALSRFEASIGSSRKAYKLGKFLADINKLRKVPIDDQLLYLELLSNAGNCVYLFMEQLTWLVKSGALSKRHQPRITLISAWAELVGYSGSITIGALTVWTCLEREAQLSQQLRLARKASDPVKAADNIERQLRLLRAKRFLKSLAIVQDLADTLLAVNDVRGGKGRLSDKAVLASAGLMSAAISAYKNWA